MSAKQLKDKLMDLDTGVVRITVVDSIKQNCIQKNYSLQCFGLLGEHLMRLLNVKTFGDEVKDALKLNTKTFKNMTPLAYQNRLKTIIQNLVETRFKTEQAVVEEIYKTAINILQSELISADLLNEFRIMLLQG